jgi:hypothetical protein
MFNGMRVYNICWIKYWLFLSYESYNTQLQSLHNLYTAQMFYYIMYINEYPRVLD